MANNSSVPYFNWFAEEIHKYPSYKFSFIAMCPSKPQMLEDMKERGCNCYWIKFNNAKRKGSMLLALPQLIKLFKLINPDVVNTHLFDDSLPALFAARLVGIKKRVITKGDTTFHWNYARKWVWADKFNNFNATNIIAISNESKEFILNNEKADPLKVKLIHHGIPFEYLCKQNDNYKKELRARYNITDNIVIGTVSRYIEWKGYRYIIEAAAEIIRKHPNVKFIFIGEGPQCDELNSLIIKYGLQGNIILAGWIERDYIPSLYGIMDIYVHAATQEPFGFVIAEAMANGVPLVTTRTGAAADALEHKKNCYFVAEKNSKDIISGINWMLKDVKRKSLISEEIKLIAHSMYDVKFMLKNYLNVYLNN
ncbi:glycosyltransferase family 4 protein [Mucilaginibacter sp.]|uniref:glycosyltransferase family 4 protein n=1 Tax=Mucilaginibacter sp. TaxID=1882438 RepID=UPI002601F998|nr:glycosyltransferase family 4 protein [Mucilaginibacter sp.]